MRIGLAGSDQTRSGGTTLHAVTGRAVGQVTITDTGSEMAEVAAAHLEFAPAMVGFHRPFAPVGCPGSLGSQGT